MADFHKALTVVLQNERGYSNDPLDSGGETFYGISRKNWPTWIGWGGIDAKKKAGQPLVLDPQLTEMVETFYLQNFWNILYDQINSQEIATKLFDLGVNIDIVPAVRLLQKALGYLMAGSFVIDGRFGSRTLDFVNGADENKLLTELRARAVQYYVLDIVARPDQQRFLLGWVRRAVA